MQGHPDFSVLLWGKGYIKDKMTLRARQELSLSSPVRGLIDL